MNKILAVLALFAFAGFLASFEVQVMLREKELGFDPFKSIGR